MSTKTCTEVDRNVNSLIGSKEMYTLHEALARERMRVSDVEMQQLRVARELAAARRWHRLAEHARAAQRRAHAASRRHTLRAL
jgi:hypothetical protein